MSITEHLIAKSEREDELTITVSILVDDSGTLAYRITEARPEGDINSTFGDARGAAYYLTERGWDDLAVSPGTVR